MREKVKIEKIIINPFLVGEVIFLAREPKNKSFKLELTDDERLRRVREELKNE